jgi:hypothetical protein
MTPRAGRRGTGGSTVAPAGQPRPERSSPRDGSPSPAASGHRLALLSGAILLAIGSAQPVLAAPRAASSALAVSVRVVRSGEAKVSPKTAARVAEDRTRAGFAPPAAPMPAPGSLRLQAGGEVRATPGARKAPVESFPSKPNPGGSPVVAALPGSGGAAVVYTDATDVWATIQAY